MNYRISGAACWKRSAAFKELWTFARFDWWRIQFNPGIAAWFSAIT
jgi:hypothetical protein